MNGLIVLLRARANWAAVKRNLSYFQRFTWLCASHICGQGNNSSERNL